MIADLACCPVEQRGATRRAVLGRVEPCSAALRRAPPCKGLDLWPSCDVLSRSSAIVRGKNEGRGLGSREGGRIRREVGRGPAGHVHGLTYRTDVMGML